MALAKLPTTGMICPMSRATLTGMGLKPPTARFVGIEAVPAGADAPLFRRLSDASARLPAAAPVEAAGRHTCKIELKSKMAPSGFSPIRSVFSSGK